jgi:hypothetical protein
MLISSASRLVGGYNSIYPGACSAASGNCAPRAASSVDGINWINSRLPLTINGHAFLLGFDPSVAVDASGIFYYCYGVSDGSSSGANAISVASSTDGMNWTLKKFVTYNSGGQFDDKYWIAADPNKTGRLYVGWDRNKGQNQTLYCAISSDGGSSWSSPIKVNDGRSSFERVIYAFPAVSPKDGTVFMAWLDYSRNKIFVDKSVNSGFSWGKDVAAATTHVGFGRDLGCNGGRTMTPAPQLGIDANGTLYLTYADDNGTGNFDVYLVKSTTGGASWTVPIKLNDDVGNAQQFNPALAVQPNGTIYVSWYDRRDDPNNCLMHIYATVSTDGGASFSPNVRVTTTASSYDGNANGPGDYSGNAAFGPGSSYAFFCSHTSSDISQQSGNAGGFETYAGTINPASTTISIAAPTVTYPSDGAVTVTVSSATGTPSGYVTLSVNGGTPVAAALAGGSASYLIPNPNAGSYTLAATYPPQGNYAASSATATLTVNKANQIISFGTLADKTFGDPPFTVSASASSGLPVSFSVVSGPATISGNTMTLTGVGVVTVRAAQTGDQNYNPAPDVDQSFTVNAAPTTTSIDAPTVTFPSDATVTVTVSSAAGTPTGTVSLTVDAGMPTEQTMSAELANGVATFTLSSPPPGDHVLTTTYTTQGNFAGSSATGTLTVQ